MCSSSHRNEGKTRSDGEILFYPFDGNQVFLYLRSQQKFSQQSKFIFFCNFLLRVTIKK